MNRINLFYIILLIFLVIFSKELILINEELILILSFAFFFFLIFSLLSKLLNDELQDRSKQILMLFNDFFATRKNALIYITSLNKQQNNLDKEIITIYENSMNIVENFKTNFINSKKFTESSIISYQLSVLSIEQLGFLSSVYDLKLNKVTNSLISLSDKEIVLNNDNLVVSNLVLDSNNFLNYFSCEETLKNYLLVESLLNK